MDETLLTVAASFFGFQLGMLMLGRVGRWGLTLAQGFKKRRTASGERVSSGGLISVFFLHSGPWLLAAVAYWSYAILSRPHALPWNWFFGAVLFSWPIMLAVGWLIDRRAKRRRAAAD